MSRRARLMASGAILAAIIGADNSFAATTCGTPNEIMTLRFAEIREQLAVAATACHDADQYRHFVTAYRPALDLSDKAMLALFERSAAGEDEYNAFRSQVAASAKLRSLANKDVFCAEARSEFAAAFMGAGTMENVISSHPTYVDLPIGVCAEAPPPAASASITASVPVVAQQRVIPTKLAQEMFAERLTAEVPRLAREPAPAAATKVARAPSVLPPRAAGPLPELHIKPERVAVERHLAPTTVSVRMRMPPLRIAPVQVAAARPAAHAATVRHGAPAPVAAPATPSAPFDEKPVAQIPVIASRLAKVAALAAVRVEQDARTHRAEPRHAPASRAVAAAIPAMRPIARPSPVEAVAQREPATQKARSAVADAKRPSRAAAKPAPVAVAETPAHRERPRGVPASHAETVASRRASSVAQVVRVDNRSHILGTLDYPSEEAAEAALALPARLTAASDTVVPSAGPPAPADDKSAVGPRQGKSTTYTAAGKTGGAPGAERSIDPNARAGFWARPQGQQNRDPRSDDVVPDDNWYRDPEQAYAYDQAPRQPPRGFRRRARDTYGYYSRSNEFSPQDGPEPYPPWRSDPGEDW